MSLLPVMLNAREAGLWAGWRGAGPSTAGRLFTPLAALAEREASCLLSAGHGLRFSWF